MRLLRAFFVVLAFGGVAFGQQPVARLLPPLPMFEHLGSTATSIRAMLLWLCCGGTSRLPGTGSPILRARRVITGEASATCC